ncbi:ankyrin repeat domain-containing protein [uncultured Pseudoalteromonas sp.]|uniref:ankyrin repeat domain-containing protein n=1 Tax=uncultured Pseudoalteromonas sp. TaxID=114053 RepID=UPI0030C8B67D
MLLDNKRLIGTITLMWLLCSNNAWSCSEYAEKIQTADLSDEGELARRELANELMEEYDFPSKILKKLMRNEMQLEKSNILKKYGDVLLDMAVYRSNYDGVKYLLDNNVPLFSKRVFIESPIFIAASSRDKKMLELFLDITGVKYAHSLSIANSYINCVNFLKSE